MSKRSWMLGIVAFIIVSGWVGYHNWCSSGHQSQSVAKAGGTSAPVSLEQDCRPILKLAPEVILSPDVLTVRLFDITSRPDAEHLQKLAVAACQILYGARRAAITAGEDTSWFNGVPFVLVDEINGATDQAQFRRKIVLPWDEDFPRLVLVASGTIRSYTGAELVWTLGHELAHGVYGHSMKRKWIVFGSIGFIILGMILAWHFKARKAQRVIGVGSILLGIVLYPVGHAVSSKYHEMSADIFGVDAAARSGLEREQAKAVALKVLETHRMDEDSWWQCGLPNLNVHPSTAERIQYIEKMVPD